MFCDSSRRSVLTSHTHSSRSMPVRTTATLGWPTASDPVARLSRSRPSISVKGSSLPSTHGHRRQRHQWCQPAVPSLRQPDVPRRSVAPDEEAPTRRLPITSLRLMASSCTSPSGRSSGSSDDHCPRRPAGTAPGGPTSHQVPTAMPPYGWRADGWSMPSTSTPAEFGSAEGAGDAVACR
jgi:hypothetical protein